MILVHAHTVVHCVCNSRYSACVECKFRELYAFQMWTYKHHSKFTIILLLSHIWRCVVAQFQYCYSFRHCFISVSFCFLCVYQCFSRQFIQNSMIFWVLFKSENIMESFAFIWVRESLLEFNLIAIIWIFDSIMYIDNNTNGNGCFYLTIKYLLKFERVIRQKNDYVTPNNKLILNKQL